MSTVVTNPPAPGTAEWYQLITASKVPAMLTDKETGEYLGIDYKTAFERYMEMTGQWNEPIDDATQAMFDDAHDAEDYAVNVWRRRNSGWQTNAGEVAYTDESLPFPNMVTLDRRARRGSRRRILEVKRPRVARGVRDNWLVQVTFQMGVTGIHEADLIEVPVYGTPEIHRIEFDERLYEVIVQDAEQFWQRIQDGEEPDAGDSEHAKEIFAALNPVSESTPPVEIDSLAMVELISAWAMLEKAEARAVEAENAVAKLMGDAPLALYDERKVCSRTTGRFSQARVPAEHKELLKDESLMTLKFDSAKLRKTHPEVYAAACGNGSFKFERKAWKEA